MRLHQRGIELKMRTRNEKYGQGTRGKNVESITYPFYTVRNWHSMIENVRVIFHYFRNYCRSCYNSHSELTPLRWGNSEMNLKLGLQTLSTKYLVLSTAPEVWSSHKFEIIIWYYMGLSVRNSCKNPKYVVNLTS